MDHGINYKTEDVVQAVMKITGSGVDVVVDPVGSTLQTSIACLGYRGRISLVGQAGRDPTKVDVSSLMAGNRSLTGVFLGAEIATDRAHNNIQRLINEVAKGELKVVIDRTFPLKDAAAAHEYIESRKAVGRVLLIP
jgi:NADPH2:quinone reductase